MRRLLRPGRAYAPSFLDAPLSRQLVSFLRLCWLVHSSRIDINNFLMMIIIIMSNTLIKNDKIKVIKILIVQRVDEYYHTNFIAIITPE